MNARPFFQRRRTGFTLLEMMIALSVLVLLCGAVFGLMTGVLQSTSTLLDNHDRRDKISALNAYLKSQLDTMTAQSTLVSYIRGDGEGLNQNGIIFGNANYATAIDSKVQPNGLYTLRVTNFATEAGTNQPQDARQVLQQSVTADDPTLTWTSLITDIKTLDWKFQDLNVTDWVEVWTNSNNPNLIEFSLQTAGEDQPLLMDYWVPKLTPVTLRLAAQPNTSPTSPTSPTNPREPGGSGAPGSNNPPGRRNPPPTPLP